MDHDKEIKSESEGEEIDNVITFVGTPISAIAEQPTSETSKYKLK